MILACIILMALLSLTGFSFYKEYQKNKTKISFKEGLDLTELPIVTFYCGEQKLHFLLDTGSNISYINLGVLDKIPYKAIDKTSSTIGVGGGNIDTKHYLIEIGYKNQKFEEEFGAVDLTEAFSTIEEESGVKLHGILGSKFFEKYKYVLDFKDLIAYR